ncbi:DUF2345 domain-containing protein, partial [Halomonas sp. A29]|uniref:DUF2345 domain-containing protein n=1 Tax=Halomonas sp. A29 TaxID=3102786 RepID=UPI00398B6BC7
GGAGDQLDLSPATQQLHSAYRLADSLSGSAEQHHAEPLDARAHLKQAGDDTQGTYGNAEGPTEQDHTTAQGASQGGRGEAARLNAPWLHLASPAGIALSTPESSHLAQGKSLSVTSGEDINLATGRSLIAIALSTPESSHLAQGKSLSVTSGEDINLATGRSLIAAISEKLSLFVQNAGIKLFAARGKVEVQAQSDAMELTAEKDVTITATKGKVHLNAANGVLLASGGGYIRIKGGDIEIHGPGKIDVKGAQHAFAGPTSMSPPLPNLPVTEPTNLDLHHTYGNGEPVPGAAYRATFADGSTRTGVLDAQGKASLAGVLPGAAQIEYFSDPRDIGLRPQEWSRDKAAAPDISALAQGQNKDSGKATS